MRRILILCATGLLAWSAPSVSAQSDLLTNLVAAWELEEASGSRADSHGSNTLAVTGPAVGSASGIVGNAALFAMTGGETLSIADNAALSMGDIDFTIETWANFASLASSRVVLSKWTDTGPDNEYWLAYFATTGNFTFFVRNTANNASGSVDVTMTEATSTWYQLIAKHNATANTITLKVNNGTPGSTSWSGGVRDGTAAFRISGQNDGATAEMQGLVDSTRIWKRLTTDTEDSWLYNSGAGRSYADIVAAGGGAPPGAKPTCLRSLLGVGRC
jgi:hypothetical protein